MSATQIDTAPAVVRGWTEGRARRARMFAFLLALTAAAALWSAFQPWYGFATTGPARCDRPSVVSTITVKAPESDTPIGGVYASACITGRGIAQQYDTAGVSAAQQQALSMLAQDNTSPDPAVLLGLPRTVTLLLLFTIVGMFGLVSRNGWLGLLAIVGFYYAHKDLGTLQTAMTSGPGGALNTAQDGLQYYGWALVLGWALLVSATLFVARHNADERQVAKRAAEAAGEDVPLSPMDQLAVFVGGKVAHGLEAAQKERAKVRAAAAGDTTP